MPRWWYTQVSKKTCSMTASRSQPLSAAIPWKRPQWYGTAPPPWGMIHRSPGKSRRKPDVSACTNAVVSAPR